MIRRPRQPGSRPRLPWQVPAVLLLATSACAAPPSGGAATPAPPHGTSSPAGDIPRAAPPRTQPGAEVPGTRVRLPQSMTAGDTAEGRVPPGSRVQAFGQVFTADSDGRVQLRAPAQPGTYDAVVEAPSRTTPLRVKITVGAP